MWDTRYRPLKFTDVLGQPGTVQLLKARLQKGTALDTSYIFSGGHGQGKTTLARIYARAMLCLNLDKSDPEPCNECDNCKAILLDQPGAFSERDAASQGTIENIRAIVDELPFSVFGAAKRVYLFDEAHRMSAGAQDVLLKPVEEKKMVGIFCTTEPDKIRGPIRSRCEDYTIRKITREDILVRMQYVLAQERVEYQDDAVLMIIDHSHGHVRDVINKMEMVAQLGPITVEGVREYLRLSVISLYYEILLSLNEPQKAISLVEQACERVSPEDVASGLAEAAMNSYRLSNGMFADFAYADRDLGRKVYAKYGAGTIVWAEYFLRSRYVSRISLLRDVLVLTQVPGNMPGETTGRPVLIPTATVQAPISEPLPTPNAVSQGEVSAQVPVENSQPVSQVKPASAPVKYLTDLDHNFVPKLEKPRGPDSGPPPKLTYPGQSNDDLDKRQLDPDTWRREFELRWTEGG